MRWLHEFDKNVGNRVQKLPTGWLPLMKGASWLGEPIVVLSVGAISFALSLKQGLNHEARALVLTFIAFGLCILLKFVLHRPRPHGLIVESLGLNSYSFPSGHAFGPVLFYGLIAYFDAMPDQPITYLMSAFVALLIFLIGLSRVYLKIHYPSDVVGGWVLGLIFLVVIITSIP